MRVNLSPQNIPFNAIGFVGTLDFSLYGAYTNLPFRVGTPRPTNSGCILSVNNQTDNLLSIIFPRSGSANTISPGGKDDFPIPIGETNAQFTVINCNPFQVYPIETLAATFISQSEQTTGMGGAYASAAPNTPAGLVGPGTFQSGVLIPAPQVLPGIFPTGAWGMGVAPGFAFVITV